LKTLIPSQGIKELLKELSVLDRNVHLRQRCLSTAWRLLQASSRADWQRTAISMHCTL
jgi:hypothetical protein